MYTLGDILGEETLTDEYKEFRLDDDTIKALYPSIRKIIKTNTFSKIVETTQTCLYTMLAKYIPKYMVAFGNTNLSHGSLYFGVTDGGEISGIPLSEQLCSNDFALIRKWIADIIEVALDMPLNISKKLIVKNEVQIEIFLLAKNEELLCDKLEEYLNDKKQKVKEYKISEKHFAYERQMYCKRLSKYQRALNDIINTTEIRTELIDYIKSSPEGTPVIKTKLIDELHSSENIHFVAGQILADKLNIETLAFWVTKFREMNVKKIMATKIVHTSSYKPLNPYYMLLRDFRPLVCKLAAEHVNIVVIKITFPCKQKTGGSLYYYPTPDDPVFLYRSVDHDKLPCIKQ